MTITYESLGTLGGGAEITRFDVSDAHSFMPGEKLIAVERTYGNPRILSPWGSFTLTAGGELRGWKTAVAGTMLVSGGAAPSTSCSSNPSGGGLSDHHLRELRDTRRGTGIDPEKPREGRGQGIRPERAMAGRKLDGGHDPRNRRGEGSPYRHWAGIRSRLFALCMGMHASQNWLKLRVVA